jgi:hypothetical protein
MARHKMNIPQHPRSFLPLLSDVLAYWRWYGERAAGTALPEIYEHFVQKIASSKVLQRLCSDQLYELKWRHALREQLGAMWEQFRYPQPPSRNRRTGGGRERLAGATHPAHTATPFGSLFRVGSSECRLTRLGGGAMSSR